MVASRSTLVCAYVGPIGLAALAFAAATGQIGPQDLAATITQQPAVFERAREHLIASPFGTIHASLFSLPRPVGTLLPEPATLASLDPTGGGVTWPVQREAERWFRSQEAAPSALPAHDVNRAAKGDLLVPWLQIEIHREILGGGVELSDASEADELEAALRFKSFPEYDVALSLEMHPQVPAASSDGSAADAGDEAGSEEGGVLLGATRLYFEAVPMTAALSPIEPWPAGEAPILMLPSANPFFADKSNTAMTPREETAQAGKGDAAAASMSVAAKGEAPAEPMGLITPAMRLKLSVKTRARAERCLANAVYFESRSEPVAGQIAVAQVVLNRAFSGYYPDDICGVVYQGAHRHLSCQFTFACDGIPDVVTEPESWERAKRIAKAALDGKIWLKPIGKATHYHAFWVNPYWVRSMRRLHKIGVHSFYRPRRWGDGSDAPAWDGGANAEVASKF